MDHNDQRAFAHCHVMDLHSAVIGVMVFYLGIQIRASGKRRDSRKNEQAEKNPYSGHGRIVHPFDLALH
jgi:hypothetical protein